MIDQEYHLTAEQVEQMTIKAVKAHLIKFCEFSETDAQAFFALFYLSPSRISKIYRTGIVVLRISKTITDEALERILVACIVRASKAGPKTSMVIAALNKIQVKEPESSFI